MLFRTFETNDLHFLPEFQPADWGDLIPRFKYFIESPCCCPIILMEENNAMGIGTSMLHEDTAWLACIIVHKNHRNNGLGKLLTQNLIDDIDRSKYQTIYLDATDFGFPVYKKLGFEVETEYVHLKREIVGQTVSISENIVPYQEAFKEQILKLDTQISGENRSKILSDFLGSSMVYMIKDQVQGYYIPDWGDGPIIATNNIAGLELMKLRSVEKNIAILPSANLAALDFLNKNGFVTSKTTKRMILGKKREWNSKGIYNRISGQLG